LGKATTGPAAERGYSGKIMAQEKAELDAIFDKKFDVVE